MKKYITVKRFTQFLSLLILFSVISCAGASDSGSPDLLTSDDFDRIQSVSEVGDVGEYTYEFWNQDEIGDAQMGLRNDGTFEIGWYKNYNMLARYGIRPGDPVHSVTYAVDNYSVSSGVSYLCVYGWAYNGSNYADLVEFYIVDNWKNYRPPGGQGYITTVTVDGDDYDIYTSTRTQQPSIAGQRTFIQYWSVRKDGTQRLSGTIDVAAHFAAWESADLPIGSTLHEVSFCVEAFGGNNDAVGHANVSQLIFNTN